MSPRAGRPPKPRLPCDEESLTRLLRAIEDAHQELEDWLAVYTDDEPGTSARVLQSLRRNLHGAQRTAEAIWRDAHDQEIEDAIRGAADEIEQILADTPAPPNHLTIIRGEKP